MAFLDNESKSSFLRYKWKAFDKILNYLLLLIIDIYNIINFKRIKYKCTAYKFNYYLYLLNIILNK